ncbi:MAG: hypothetical protein AB1401_11635, partial [Thermodesulfobacteriota bacterium]
QIASSEPPVISLSVPYVTSTGDHCKPDRLCATIQDSLFVSDKRKLIVDNFTNNRENVLVFFQ